MAGDAERQQILETKGYDPLELVKKQAAEGWVSAVNADGQYGHWAYAIAHRPEDVLKRIYETVAQPEDS